LPGLTGFAMHQFTQLFGGVPACNLGPWAGFYLLASVVSIPA